MRTPASQRIIVPLDVSTPAEALAIVGRLKGRVGMFKVGLQLFTAAGPAVVSRIVAAGERVFLDLKLHDIPNTVAHAATEAARLGVAMFDLHLSGGARMLGAAREAVDALNLAPERRPRLLGITVLTSLNQDDLAAVGVTTRLEEQVVALARLGKEAGLDGVVASSREVAAIRRACGEAFVIVTPGIRPEGYAPSDQKRVTSPREAVAAGADYLVIGRPILEAPDPVAAVDAIARELA
ncbi:MAG TPA: orotidine-5'-phosphate decarboxylase [Candidatus Polarisedimenticolia bacterium]